MRGTAVHYGSKRAVDGVDLEVAPGEVLAVLGPSGCGKSTLLRAVAGLEELTSGTVSFDGADLDGVPTHRRGFAMMFQEGQLFGHTDVAGNVGYGLKMRGLKGSAAEAEIVRLLDLVGLSGYGDRRPDTLSGGEQQRVALARALATAPRLLLLDEPLSALDRSLRERLATDLRRVLLETGTSALLVTHDHDEAFTVADRMAVMRGGRIVQEGPTLEVWRAPADVWVARFLGVENVLTREQAVALLEYEEDVVAAAEDRARRRFDRIDGAARTFGIRRSAVRIADPGGVRGRAVALTMGRDGLRVDVDLPDVGTVAALADATAELREGDEVSLSADPEALMALP